MRIERELDFVLHIVDRLKSAAEDFDSVNRLIGSLPCEWEYRDLLLDYTRDSTAATTFLNRLLGVEYQGHVYYTFRTLRENPYVTVTDTVLLLHVGLSQHGFNLSQDFTQNSVNS